MPTTVNRHSEVVHSSTTISIDAMGGDLGPAAVIAGIVRAAKKKTLAYTFFCMVRVKTCKIY
jgi:fatty acid/phospholipid biosynthesis enzyme